MQPNDKVHFKTVRVLLSNKGLLMLHDLYEYCMGPLDVITTVFKKKIQSMVDVPIHQEDIAVQRTPLIDPVISMVTEKTASTPTSPTTQAHVHMCSTSCWKDISRGV
ncbi:hypothetical protein Tco_0784167 [Tanacetum coccineum]